jgi:hypothetical protein
MAKTNWDMEAEYVQSCNCDYGCPCNFNGYPTYGNCEALVGYHILHGKFGSTKLDGVSFAMAAWWPKAIHEGNGVARIWVDTSATPAQVQAVNEITSGKHGGGAFEIFAKTFGKVYPTKQAKIHFDYKGVDSSFSVEGVGEVRSEAIRNPVSGEKFQGSVVLPSGIAWKQADATNIRRWWMHDEDILAVHENRAGFVTVVRIDPSGPLG